MNKISLILVPILFLGVSCIPEKESTSIEPALGMWHVSLNSEDRPSLPFTAELKRVDGKYNFVIHNANENIIVKDINHSGKALQMSMPVFESVFEGKLIDSARWEGMWRDPSRGDDYSIPFVAVQGKRARFGTYSSEIKLDTMYEVAFSQGTNDEYPAIGYFYQNGAKVSGTFRTETGDYRFLEGGLNGNKMELSAFDGSHAFLFDAEVKKDGTLEGTFYSGNHWKEPWVGKPNTEVKLTDPEQLTYLKEGYTGIEFSFPDKNGKMITYPTDSMFQGKAVIIQILGSWCPNCMDETSLFARWYKQYHGEGLEIIGLAFERQKLPERAFAAIDKMKKSLDVDYPIVLASNTTNKKTASEKLPMLSRVISYPTSIFIDKGGNIRTIHTGFNGPATGRLYDEFVNTNEQLIRQMLAE
ncbi:MAG: TlpA disulfide reductase family protein [Bacteroidota bacterium]